MNNLQKKLIDSLNEIGEISSNYEYYKIEDRGAFYTTYQSFTNHDENNFISIGLNVTREKSTHHMKLIQIPFKVKSDFFLIIIDLLTPHVEKFKILNNDTELQSLGTLSLEEITEYLTSFTSFFNIVLNNRR